MSSEPERPIEKLLHASAKERRELAKGSWELHPATRKLLQGEVARRFGTAQTSRTSFWSWLMGQFRVRPVGTVSAVAVPILAVLLVLPLLLSSKHPSQNQDPQTAQTMPSSSPIAPEFKGALAFNEPSGAQKTQSNELLADNKAITKEEVILARDSQAQELVKDTGVVPRASLEKAENPPEAAKQVLTAADLEAANKPSGIAAPSLAVAQSAPPLQQYDSSSGFKPAETSTAGQNIGGARVENQVMLARKLAAPAAAASSAQVRSSTDQVAEGSATLRQYAYSADQVTLITNAVAFQQLNQKNLKTRAAYAVQTPTVENVLVSFQVQQQGDQMRVIDSDGSVYSGLLQSPGQVAPGTSLNTQTKAADALKRSRMETESVRRQSNLNAQVPGLYTFRVIGTNRSLDQPVVFSGTLDAITNTTDSERGRVQNNGAGVGGNSIQWQQILQNARLSGTAVVGSDQKIKIEAAPVAQPPLR